MVTVYVWYFTSARILAIIAAGQKFTQFFSLKIFALREVRRVKADAQVIKP